MIDLTTIVWVVLMLAIVVFRAIQMDRREPWFAPPGSDPVDDRTSAAPNRQPPRPPMRQGPGPGPYRQR